MYLAGRVVWSIGVIVRSWAFSLEHKKIDLV
jgi:hypothetical protein